MYRYVLTALTLALSIFDMYLVPQTFFLFSKRYDAAIGCTASTDSGPKSVQMVARIEYRQPIVCRAVVTLLPSSAVDHNMRNHGNLLRAGWLRPPDWAHGSPRNKEMQRRAGILPVVFDMPVLLPPGQDVFMARRPPCWVQDVMPPCYSQNCFTTELRGECCMQPLRGKHAWH